MHNLIFTRIDDRLIHGQVCAAWLKTLSDVRHILIVDDDTAADPFMGEMFELLIPPHITIEIRTVDEAIRILTVGLDKPTMMIVKRPQTIKRLTDGGVLIDFVNIGGMGMTAGRKKFFQNISASDEEKEIFKELIARGIKVEIQIIPAQGKYDVARLLG